MKKMPKEIFIYLDSTLDDGTPIYAVAANLDEIPDASDGDKIGAYTLNRQYVFRVRRELS